MTSHLDIFDCTGKDISVQTIQLSDKFINFGWDPKGILFFQQNKCFIFILKN